MKRTFRRPCPTGGRAAQAAAARARETRTRRRWRMAVWVWTRLPGRPGARLLLLQNHGGGETPGAPRENARRTAGTEYHEGAAAGVRATRAAPGGLRLPAMRFPPCACFLGAFSLPALAAADGLAPLDWPQFRGRYASGIADGARPP